MAFHKKSQKERYGPPKTQTHPFFYSDRKEAYDNPKKEL